MSDKTKAIFSVDFNDHDAIPGVTQLLNPKAAAEKTRRANPVPPSLLMSSKNTAKPEMKTQVDLSARTRSITQTFTPAEAQAPTPNQVTQEIHVTFDDEDSLLRTVDTNAAFEPTRLLEPVPAVGLAGLGVQFELQFELEGNCFRYSRMKPHAKNSLELWQEKFFFQMKIDLRVLEIQVSFQEFSKKQNPFQEDAFGMTDASYVQVVRIENDPKRLYVLFSAQSLLLRQEEVRALLSGIAPGGSNPEHSGELKIELAS